MPLLATDLKSLLLESVYDGTPKSTLEAADGIVSSYIQYAQKATTCMSAAILLSGKSVAVSMMAAAMLTPAPIPIFINAIASLWLPSSATLVPPGTATVLPPAIAASVATLVARIVTPVAASQDEAAEMLANTLHILTTTILVLHPNAPPALPPCVLKLS